MSESLMGLYQQSFALGYGQTLNSANGIIGVDPRAGLTL
jgi:hypothetical protein